MLATSLELAKQGDRKAAHSAALSAYLDGFELAEPSLVIVDKQLKLAIEKEMIDFRETAKKGSVAELEQIEIRLVELLNEAKDTLSTSGMSSSAAFFGAFIILLREGVEAILVLAAIMAALIKTGRREAMKYIHIGWISAVVLGVITWWVADNLIQISGASRELTEGIAALVAAAILVYVGFWLHNASHSKRWKQFVEHRIGNAMESGTLWVLATVAFIAVYREMFETVLFYQAMWVQIDTGTEQSFMFGIVAAITLLVVIALLVYKAGVRLPIKQFFQINAILLFLLAVIFTGQGIAALQEAGLVSTSLLDFPRIEILGVYPTAQSLGLQLLVLLLGAGLLLYQKKTSQA
jgi:high-affinity iron transporter